MTSFPGANGLLSQPYYCKDHKTEDNPPKISNLTGCLELAQELSKDSVQVFDTKSLLLANAISVTSLLQSRISDDSDSKALPLADSVLASAAF